MESSSEDGSFVWTDASDSTSSEDMNSGGEESEYDKSYKKKLHKVLFTNDNGHETEVRSKKRKRERYTSESEHSETAKKKIKVEPESDLDVANVEGKDSRDVVNGYNDHLLDEKVKKEQEFVLPSDNVKKKKRKKSISSENVDIQVKLDTELNQAEDKLLNKCNINEDSSNRLVCEASKHRDEYNVTKKKKKKKKSEKREESPPTMEIDENYQQNTVQQQPSQSKEKRKKKETVQRETHSVRDHTRDYSNVSQDLTTMDTTTGDIDISDISKISNVNITQDESLLVQNNKSRRKLSQRIQFEDEVVDSEPRRPTMQLPTTAVTTVRGTTSDKLKRFADKQRLKTCVIREPTEFTISEGDDVWVVTCPSEVDVLALRGRSLEVGGRCKVKVGGATYEGGADGAGADVAVAGADVAVAGVDVAVAVGARLRRVPLVGRLALHRRVPRAPDPPASAPAPPPSSARVPLPDTKLRHPLLGAHYKKALKLPPAVRDRLQADPTPLPSKKKAKRKKHDLESAETWESERAIEESLFDF